MTSPRQIIAAYAEGGMPAEIALMRLILATRDPAELDALLDGPGELGQLRALARRHPGAWRTVRATAAAVPHDVAPTETAEAAVAQWGKWFDAAARVSPEAGVALYSLGDPQRLAEATDEIVDWMEGAKLLGRDRDFLDIGCGIGRFEVALAGRVGSIIGTDVSGEMVAIARQRCATLPNVEIRQSTGLDLSEFGDANIDCILAVDALPYVVAAGSGLIETHFREFGRVLRAGGDMLVLNYSYRNDLALDRKDIAGNAAIAGLEVIRKGETPFRHWDGVLFQLRKPAS
jgi:SAM-dependent methyltransferase